MRSSYIWQQLETVVPIPELNEDRPHLLPLMPQIVNLCQFSTSCHVLAATTQLHSEVYCLALDCNTLIYLYHSRNCFACHT